jgi:CubicO group peptidase (beta-lactamase class C family)
MERHVFALIACTLVLMLPGCTDFSGENRKVADPEEAKVLEALSERLSDEQAEGLLFFSTPERRVAFRNIDRLYPTRTVHAAASPLRLEDNPKDLAGLTYTVDDETYTLADLVKMPSSMGLIVVKDGEVLFEHYGGGNNAGTRWVSFSVTKSVTSMLIGAAIADGYIASVDEPVAHYLPRLRGTPYEDATIEHVLNMASGVAWNEDYEDPESDVAKAGGANGLELVQYLAELPKTEKVGETFNYNTGETNLAGEILRAAIGNNASVYLTHKIWQPFGMESDATWLTGGPGGGETGGCCISATLRDYARIGMFAMNGGVLADGTRVLPQDWMAMSTQPSRGYEGYGYLWWLHGDGSYAALGIFEQQIYVDPAAQLVIAAHSNAPTATGSDYGRHLEAVTQAIRQAL